jgi:penicillin-binding protein 1A
VIGSPAKRGKHRLTRAASSKNQASSSAPATPAGGKRKRGFFRRYWWGFLLVPLIIFAGLAGTFVYVYAHTTLPDLPPGPQTTYVYDRNGHLITTLNAEVKRTIIPIAQMPADLQHAVIAIEDKNFYHEGGVSYIGILRAAIADLRHRQLQQGGSTITQQYVKNVYTGGERSFGRKIKEAILAVKLSHKLTKTQILEKYLNTVYFGEGAYGVQAAAETYWGIPASRLNTLQSATLAGLIRAPSTYDPVTSPRAAKERRNLVLAAMADQGYLTSTEAQRLQSRPVRVLPRRAPNYPHGYFVQYVSEALQSAFGTEETFTGGLRVTTTLDSAMQAAAEKAISDHLPSPTDPAAALVAIDPLTGEIRAMVGGKDFTKQKINFATSAHRQTGSAFKPFTLTAAMEEKISLNSVWNGPPQIDIRDPRCRNPDGTDWMPHNSADESAGTMRLVDATAHSVNTIFAQLVTVVGPEHVVDVAGRMGIESELRPLCSITLGAQSVTPLEMTDAYATLAARGVRHSPISIDQVKTSSGQVVFKANPKGEQALGQNDADLVTYALQGVITHGTGVAANIGRPAAGKTGTTDNYVDAWFCGYTPQLTACVWMGYPKNELTSMVNVEGVYHVFGGTIPAMIWHDFMTAAMAGQPVKEFATPDFTGYNVNPPGSVSPTPSPTPAPSPSPSPKPPPPPSPSASPSPLPSLSPSPSSSGGEVPAYRRR